MSVPQRAAAVIAAAAFVCSTAYAPIYGTYPGLRSLIKQSEVIAAATVLEALPEIDIGGGERYKIEFIKVLKGSPAQKQAIAWLRPLEIIPQAEALGRCAPLGQSTISRRHNSTTSFALDIATFYFSSGVSAGTALHTKTLIARVHPFLSRRSATLISSKSSHCPTRLFFCSA